MMMKPHAKIIKLGTVNYNEALYIQEKIRHDVTIREEENTILLLEHPPTITYGLRINKNNLFLSEELLNQKNISLFKTTRGGDITFHGPGQLIIYPIILLKDYNYSIVQFIEMLENTIITVLKKLQLTPKIIPKFRGVFINDKKIASIGVNVKKYVTMHGAALNINTDLDFFKYINPCGLNVEMTSVASELNKKIDMDYVISEWINAFTNYSKSTLEIIDRRTD